tara:strand:+ start:178 stop:393 length:216 start_codon:yes stop_codon:yes gene_type:complete
MSELFKGIFGDKKWFHSLTAWGVVVFVASTAGMESACAAELVSVETCGMVEGFTSKLSAVLVTLGIRKGIN